MIGILLAVWMSGGVLHSSYLHMPDLDTCIVARNTMRVKVPAAHFECVLVPQGQLT